MSIRQDNPLIAKAQDLSEGEGFPADSIAQIVAKAVFSAALPFGIGSAITGIASDVGQMRWKERVHELMIEMCAEIQRLKVLIPDVAYYRSEEFQATFFEAVDQERTNTSGYKRTLLAKALAKSGTRAFTAESEKDLFFRLLRDLMQSDLELLKELSKPVNDTHEGLQLKAQTLKRTSRVKAVNPRVFRLQGLGFVATHQLPGKPNLSGMQRIQSVDEITSFITKALDTEPQMVIEITNFGSRFVAFLLTDVEVKGV